MRSQFLIVFILFSSFNAKSQGTFIGISGGLSGCIEHGHFDLLTTDTKIYEESGLKLNFTGGISANFRLNDNFSFQSDILFEDKGFSSNGQFPKDYLQFNELIRYTYIPQRKKVSPFFELGPYFSYFLYTNEFNPENIIMQQNIINDFYAKTLWGLTAGTGCNIPFRKTHISVRLQYDQNLSSPIGEYIMNVNSKNDIKEYLYYSVLSLKFEYYIPIKLKFLKKYSD